MKEYERHIEIYATHPHRYNTALVSPSQWGDKIAAERYLGKYWLPLAEYKSVWEDVQSRIFLKQKCLPDLVFLPQYELLACRGGCLFVQEDFKKLQECMISLGNEYFFVVENQFEGQLKAEEPAFRMKYPAQITWEELTSGNFVSSMIVDFSNKDFYVFGDTPAWGKYSASTYESPLDIVGFLPEYSPLFKREFSVSEMERLEVNTEWAPAAYRHLLS